MILIAEIGINHNGDLQTARELIRQARRAGADIAKFQFYDPAKIFGPSGSSPNPQAYRHALTVQFGREEAARLNQWCDDEGIEFMASVFDEERFGWVESLGVEINPQAARSDTWIGSFDALPSQWTHAFGLVYSNAFDHCQDPHRTIQEWKRVIRPGGYLMLCYVKDQQVLASEPVGELEVRDILELSGGELVYFHDEGSANRYSEVIVQVPTPR